MALAGRAAWRESWGSLCACVAVVVAVGMMFDFEGGGDGDGVLSGSEDANEAGIVQDVVDEHGGDDEGIETGSRGRVTLSAENRTRHLPVRM